MHDLEHNAHLPRPFGRGHFAVAFFVFMMMRPAVASGSSVPFDPTQLNCDRELTVSKDSDRRKALSEDSALEFEHCYRAQNLARLALRYSGRSSPQFFVDRIPADRLGPGAKVAVPVLRVVFPDRVFFDTGKDQLRPEALEAVAIIAEALRSDPPDVTVFVAGHTDSRGDADFNYNLSVKRSEAVAKELARRRDIVANVWGIGFGEDMPMAANVDEWSWGQNRRVEFLFSGTPQAIAVWLSDMQLDNLCVIRAGEAADRCQREITLRKEYQAIEFVAPVSTTVMPSSAKGRVVGVDNQRRVINPVPGRRFKINPQRRSVSKT